MQHLTGISGNILARMEKNSMYRWRRSRRYARNWTAPLVRWWNLPMVNNRRLPQWQIHNKEQRESICEKLERPWIWKRRQPDLLAMVFGVTETSQFIFFENQVHLDHTSFIDGYIEKTHVMIEDIIEFLEGKAIKISAWVKRWICSLSWKLLWSKGARSYQMCKEERFWDCWG